jgi:hypothetical protein
MGVMKALSADSVLAGMPGSFGVWFWEEHLLAVHDMGAMKALFAALVMAGMPGSFDVLVSGSGGGGGSDTECHGVGEIQWV